MSLRESSTWQKRSSGKFCASILRTPMRTTTWVWCSMARGLPAQAISNFLRVHPANIATRFNLVRAYLEAGRTAEGLSAAKALSLEGRDDVQLHFTLGILLASAKQYDPARRELEKANALQPETFEILFSLGQIYFRAADYSKSELVLTRALKLKPDSATALALLAQVYSAENKPVDALDLLARAHKLVPDDTDIILLLARLSMSQNYFEDAIPLLESGLKIAPKRADLHAALGECYFMTDRVEKAIEEFKILIELNPSAPSYASLGLSYRHLGRFDEARTIFSGRPQARSSQCFVPVQYGIHRGAQGKPGDSRTIFSAGAEIKSELF